MPAVPGRLGRIEAAVRDHPLRTPYGVETVPRLLCLDDRAYTDRGERPPPATPLWCRDIFHACCAWMTGAYGDRSERPPLAHPSWCRDSATPAVPERLGRIETAVRDHPLRTPHGVEKVPRLLCLDDRGV